MRRPNEIQRIGGSVAEADKVACRPAAAEKSKKKSAPGYPG